MKRQLLFKRDNPHQDYWTSRVLPGPLCSDGVSEFLSMGPQTRFLNERGAVRIKLVVYDYRPSITYAGNIDLYTVKLAPPFIGEALGITWGWNGRTHRGTTYLSNDLIPKLRELGLIGMRLYFDIAVTTV